MPCLVRVGIEDSHQFRAAFVDILVLQVLGMRQHIVFPEQGVGTGDVVVASLGYQGAPAAACNIGETDVVAGAVSTEEEGDPEGPVLQADQR